MKKKNVVLCGDLNCAHKPIDLHAPKTNLRSAGFTIEERESFDKYIDKLKMIDTFRHFHNDKIKYSYWSYRGGARKKNKGWRIDYFLVTKSFIKSIKSTEIHDKELGSDHAPIELIVV